MPPPATPQMNGIPQNIMAIINNLKQEMKQEHHALVQKHDCLTIVTQRLQMQYNNLTMDEVCQAMMDQFAVIWPHAKNYNNAINSLRSDFAKMQQMAQSSITTAETAGITAGEAKKTAEDARQSAAAADNVVLGTRGGLEKLDRRVGNVEISTQSASAAASSCQTQLDNFVTSGGSELAAVKTQLKEILRRLAEAKAKSSD